MLVKITHRMLRVIKDSDMDENIQELKRVLRDNHIEYEEDSNHIIFTQSTYTRYKILYELTRHFNIELV